MFYKRKRNLEIQPKISKHVGLWLLFAAVFGNCRHKFLSFLRGNRGCLPFTLTSYGEAEGVVVREEE